MFVRKHLGAISFYPKARIPGAVELVNLLALQQPWSRSEGIGFSSESVSISPTGAALKAVAGAADARPIKCGITLRMRNGALIGSAIWT